MEYEIQEDETIELTIFDWEDFQSYPVYPSDKNYKKLKRLLEREFKQTSWFRFIRMKEFNKVIKEADEVTTWIDYLRISLDAPLTYFEEILDQLDYDNSNLYVDTQYWITWTKFRLSFGPCILWSTVYDWVSFPIILYNKFDENRQSVYKSYWKIDLYGAYWRMVELWYLEPDLVEKLIKSKDPDEIDILQLWNITRLDYKIDLFYRKKTTIPHYSNLLKLRKNSKLWLKHVKEEVKRWEELQSWAYWSKQAKRVFLRVYDKLADTESKWKYVLYADYFNFESVYRIEFELLNHFCKGFKYKDYLDLVEKFWNSIQLKYLWKVFYEYNQEPDFEKIEQRIRYFKDFIGRWERIAERWFNPFLILYKWLGGNWKITEEKLVDMVYQLYEYAWW